MSKPKNWPESLPYLTAPLHHKKLTPTQLKALSTKPPSSSTIQIIPAQSTQLLCPLVKITPITLLSHPAHGQNGLFATRDLKPGTFIIAYLGLVHPSSATDPNSDYDLWLDRDADLAVDASKEGNEARFVNDYRGVKAKSNAEFGSGWSERWKQLCVGFWVLPAGKGEGKGGGFKGIRRGEEILVNYGKGFWGGRAG